MLFNSTWKKYDSKKGYTIQLPEEWELITHERFLEGVKQKREEADIITEKMGLDDVNLTGYDLHWMHKGSPQSLNISSDTYPQTIHPPDFFKQCKKELLETNAKLKDEGYLERNGIPFFKWFFSEFDILGEAFQVLQYMMVYNNLTAVFSYTSGGIITHENKRNIESILQTVEIE